VVALPTRRCGSAFPVGERLAGARISPTRARDTIEQGAGLSLARRHLRLSAQWSGNRSGGIRFIVVGAMPLHYHRTKLSTIANDECRVARPASPPNQRMNPALLFLNRYMPVGSERLKRSAIRPLDPQGRLSAALLGAL